MKTMNAIITECGNGFPSVGDYAPGGGNLYRVVSITDRIQTGRSPGAGNWIRATVEEVDWSDCAEGAEFEASVTVENDEDADDVTEMPAECLRCGLQADREMVIGESEHDSKRAADGCARCGSHDTRAL